MSNNSNGNPVIADSTGWLFGASSTKRISGIQIAPTGATWSIILKNGAGSIIFSANNNNHGNFNPANPFTVTGLQVDTATSVVAYIYLDP